MGLRAIQIQLAWHDLTLTDRILCRIGQYPVNMKPDQFFDTNMCCALDPRHFDVRLHWLIMRKA